MSERRGRVEGKVAIVTGAGSTPGPGIATGRACAIVLAREGARVLLADINPEQALYSVTGVTPETEYRQRLAAASGLLGTNGDGWDVGWAAAFLASDEARWITGVVLPVDGGVMAVTPLMMAPHLRAERPPPA